MRVSVVLGFALLGPLSAQAELAILDNGSVLHVASRRLGAGCVELLLSDGGSVCVAAARLMAFVPEEQALPFREPELHALARQAAERHGLSPELVLSVVATESGFVPDAVSPKGAAGLMQLMPATAAELGVRDVFDPAQNLDGGSRYLGALLKRYDGDVARSLAAYNAGPGAVARHAGIPPYPETRRYVSEVLRRVGESARP